jgi:glycosyltransferase involved in cell wall biosynthesis
MTAPHSNRPLRVCLVTREFAQDTVLGGIGRATSMQARILAAAGAEVHVITLAASTPAHYVEHGVHVHRVRDPKGYLAPDMVYAHVARWAKAVADVYAELDLRHPFDVVEAPEYWGEALHLPLRPETPLVVTLHGLTELLEAHNIDEAPTPGQRVLYALELAAIRRAALLLAPTQLILDDTRELLMSEEPPARLLPLSFDATRFPEREARALEPGVRRLVFTGRLERRKGVDFAVRAAAAIARRGYETELVVVGRDWSDYRQRVIEPLVEELGFTGLRILSEVGEREVAELLRGADCALMPSRQENFHMAANEALSSGVPVITSDRNGLTCWHDADHGLLGLPLEDPERFAELAADALEDEAWLTESGARGAAQVRQLLAPGRVGTAQLAIYEELADEARAAAGLSPLRFGAAQGRNSVSPASPSPAAPGFGDVTPGFGDVTPADPLPADALEAALPPAGLALPRLIHIVWAGRGAAPARVAATAAGWEREHPGWQVVVWTEDTLPPLRNQAIFDACTDVAQREQIARYEVVRRYGGITVASGVECLRCIQPLVEGLRAFVVGRPDRRPTAEVLGGIAGHAFLEDLVAGVPRGIATHPGGAPEVQTGDELVLTVLTEGTAQRRPLPEALAAHHFFPDAPVPDGEADTEPYAVTAAAAAAAGPVRFVAVVDPAAPGVLATVARGYCSAFAPGEPVELALCVPDDPTEEDGALVMELLGRVAPDPGAVPDVVLYSFTDVLELPYVAAVTATGDDVEAGIQAGELLESVRDLRELLDARYPLPRQLPGEKLAPRLRDRLVAEMRRTTA